MIDFLKYRYLAAFFSLIVIVGAVGVYFYKMRTYGYAFTYSVDFTGGTQVLLNFEKEVHEADIRNAIQKQKWTGVTLRKFSDTDFLIRVKEFSNDVEGIAIKIQGELQKKMPGNTISIQESEVVGPGVGKALRSNSIRALFFAVVALLIYIACRFWSIAFACGAVVALFHDAFIMLAAFLLFDREISVNLNTAILMVLGYSINDTIVIFSRVRDRLIASPDISLYNVVNASLNYTFRRTILTTVSTALVVGSMYLFGGEALNDFAFALLIGIVFGTYSSIYIASPVMMVLK